MAVSKELERVIFSVDFPDVLTEYKKALKHLDDLRVTKMRGGVTMLIGCYEQRLEPSFMVLAVDWDDVLLRNMSPFMYEQDSVLRIPGDPRQPCVLEYLDNDERVALGPMRQGVGEGWSYVIGDNKYFTCDLT